MLKASNVRCFNVPIGQPVTATLPLAGLGMGLTGPSLNPGSVESDYEERRGQIRFFPPQGLRHAEGIVRILAAFLVN